MLVTPADRAPMSEKDARLGIRQGDGLPAGALIA
jgi:hypothetical protein